jgi:hypothetical protein
VTFGTSLFLIAGDLGVRQTGRHGAQDLLFALGQRLGEPDAGQVDNQPPASSPRG